MDLIDGDTSPINTRLSIQPLQPSRIKRQIPPDIIIKIASYLPLHAITNVALASRRFKVLAYDDEIWERKLASLGLYDGPITESFPSSSQQPIGSSPDIGKSRSPSTRSLSTDFSSLSTLGQKTDVKLKQQHRKTITPSNQPPNALIDTPDNHFFINNKPLYTLIPGIYTDPYAARARAKSTGRARELFRDAYIRLKDYYLDFRNPNGTSKVLQDLGADPIECGKILRQLTGLGKCSVVDDHEEINDALNSVCQYFASASLHQFEVAYDAGNIPEMKKYAISLIELDGGQSCIQTFIQKHPIFFDNPYDPLANLEPSDQIGRPLAHFMEAVSSQVSVQANLTSQVFPNSEDVSFALMERIFEDVIGEYVTDLLYRAQNQDTYLYLCLAAQALQHCLSLVDLMENAKACSIPRTRGMQLVIKLFEPLAPHYIRTEQNYAKQACQKCIEKWMNEASQQADMREDAPNLIVQKDASRDQSKDMDDRNHETYRRNYMHAFKKVITMPIDLVATAAKAVPTTFQKRAEPASPTSKNSSTDSLPDVGKVETTTSNLNEETPPPSPVTVKPNTASSRAASTQSKRLSDQPDQPRSSVSLERQMNRASKELIITEVRGALDTAKVTKERMQDLLSLELALNLIHENKEAEHRVQLFNLDFSDSIQNSVKKAFEHVFVILLRAVGPLHIQTAFASAADMLASLKPDDESLLSKDVAPLPQFFELVHIADLIQQMVDVYYNDTITKHVDKNDFMSEVVKEKKNFERLLDDSVAKGMDKAIQLLINSVDFILFTQQDRADFSPNTDKIDLQPTMACRQVIDCLTQHKQLLQGLTDRNTMDVFYQEFARRFYESLCKHIKRQTITELGGFQLISDLNAYFQFVVTLRQSSILSYFSALKALANIYIISSPSDIKDVIHDIERYNGILRVEDVLEFAAHRSDWALIRKEVEKDRTDCTIM